MTKTKGMTATADGNEWDTYPNSKKGSRGNWGTVLKYFGAVAKMENKAMKVGDVYSAT